MPKHDPDRLARARLNDTTWGNELDAVLARIRSRVPQQIPEEEIQRDALDAIHEARRAIRTHDG